jgi:hypothetical protein
MSEHQETLKQVVARIEASFVKIQHHGEKVDQFRISAGKQLVELKDRIEAGEAGKGVKWWSWYTENFKNRTRRDAQKVMALANADNPEEAAEEERAKNRAAVAAHRRRAAQAEEQERSEDTSYGKTQSHGSDLPDDAAADERAAHWAEEMFRRIQQDCKEEDLDPKLCFTELVKLLAAEIGTPEPTKDRKVLDTAPAPKRLGRPKGSKNKPKQTGSAPPSAVPEPPPTPPTRNGNEDDVDNSAAAMKAKMKELASAEESSPTAPNGAAPDGSLDLRGTFLDRRNEQQGDAGAAA